MNPRISGEGGITPIPHETAPSMLDRAQSLQASATKTDGIGKSIFGMIGRIGTSIAGSVKYVAASASNLGQAIAKFSKDAVARFRAGSSQKKELQRFRRTWNGTETTEPSDAKEVAKRRKSAPTKDELTEELRNLFEGRSERSEVTVPRRASEQSETRQQETHQEVFIPQEALEDGEKFESAPKTAVKPEPFQQGIRKTVEEEVMDQAFENMDELDKSLEEAMGKEDAKIKAQEQISAGAEKRKINKDENRLATLLDLQERIEKMHPKTFEQNFKPLSDETRQKIGLIQKEIESNPKIRLSRSQELKEHLHILNQLADRAENLGIVTTKELNDMKKFIAKTEDFRKNLEDEIRWIS